MNIFVLLLAEPQQRRRSKDAPMPERLHLLRNFFRALGDDGFAPDLLVAVSRTDRSRVLAPGAGLFSKNGIVTTIAPIVRPNDFATHLVFREGMQPNDFHSVYDSDSNKVPGHFIDLPVSGPHRVLAVTPPGFDPRSLYGWYRGHQTAAPDDRIDLMAHITFDDTRIKDGHMTGPSVDPLSSHLYNRLPSTYSDGIGTGPVLHVQDL